MNRLHLYEAFIDMVCNVCLTYFIFQGRELAGITQYISPVAGGSYKFLAKFKLLNQDSDKLWHQVEILIHEVYPSGKQTVYFNDL